MVLATWRWRSLGCSSLGVDPIILARLYLGGNLDKARGCIIAVASPSRGLALQARRSSLVAFDPPYSSMLPVSFDLSNQ